MKKIIACMLSMMLFLGSYTSVSAAQLPQFEKATLLPDTRTSTKIDQTQFITLHPDDTFLDGISASIIEHSITAHRENDGSVTLTIDEIMHTVRGYYEHLATDASGENFIPNKNKAIHTYSGGISTMYLSSDSVSSDGYVYLKFAITPVGGNAVICGKEYKIPVDYNKYSTEKRGGYLPLNSYGLYAPCFSAQVAFFSADVKKLTDNSVEVIIDIESSNTKLWFRHLATSKDGDIFIPQKDSLYYISSKPISNQTYKLILPENSVSSNGYVYLEAVFDLPIGMTHVGTVKLAINN
ncbi:hypothetical protein [Thomasclavelia cocleata]|uniref:hypothetical protein n=1 Tax=Thomasclavelia cocleata TaxID=69824 RepID=UPI00249468AE|nr:hypothetical protein [Thomasclavelia cocleata]